ncbi:hypothetical protein [Microbacterium deminutum]|uniref:TRAM domain-containing protein n=1 Tax=Microbacterium deminutum TaxID=344164 RepID=A0ABP5BXE2_9MICO
MADTTLRSGDRISATVTKSAPFGALVETADGVPGLVPSSTGQPGDQLELRVESFDQAKGRFSATPA